MQRRISQLPPVKRPPAERSRIAPARPGAGRRLREAFLQRARYETGALAVAALCLAAGVLAAAPGAARGSWTVLNPPGRPMAEPQSWTVLKGSRPGPGELRIENLPEDLNLSADQRTRMEAALDRLARERWETRERGEGRGCWEARGRSSARERAHRGFEPGADSTGRRPAAWSEPGHPMQDFLEESARILNPEQFTRLLNFLAERKENSGARSMMRPGRGWMGPDRGWMGPDRRWMGPGPGWPRSHGPLGPWGGVPGPYGRPGYGPPPWSWPPRPGPVPGRPGIHDAWRRHPHDREMGGRLAQRLHLTPEQRARLGEELRSHRDELRDLRAAVQAGKFDSADARVQARDIRTDLEREVKRILTPQQFDQMQKIRQERMKHRIDRRLENLGRESGRRIEFLTRVLGLSDSQASQIKEIAQSSLSDRRHVLEQLRDGKIEDAQAADQMRQIREQEISRVRELLNPDQKERFEALRKLAGPRHSQRPGPGRSPRWG